MAGIAPRILVTDERHNPLANVDMICYDRKTTVAIMLATTDKNGIAQFTTIDENRDYWFRAQSARTQAGQNYGQVHIQVLTNDTSQMPVPVDDVTKNGDDGQVFLRFTTQPQQIVASVASANITIKRLNAAGDAITSGDLVIHLYTTSSGGSFSANPVTITNTNSTVSFTYTDSVAGNPVITASTGTLS